MEKYLVTSKSPPFINCNNIFIIIIIITDVLTWKQYIPTYTEFFWWILIFIFEFKKNNILANSISLFKINEQSWYGSIRLIVLIKNQLVSAL